MFFGTAIFCTVAMAVKSITRGVDLCAISCTNPLGSAVDLQSFTSLFELLYQISILGCIMFYVYICENHPPYPHGEKTVDPDRVFFFSALLLIAALFTLRKNGVNTSSGNKVQTSSLASSFLSSSRRLERPLAVVNEANEILNRDQTEEWKGWMQCVLLLYQYHEAAELYNVTRALMTSYVWMTGFGHGSYFYRTGDFSFVRLVHMLWRLNFLVVVLCLTQGTTYILYYVCMLHTYYFIMVYATLRFARHLNYTKWGVRIKLIILAMIIFMTWDMNTGMFQALHWPFLSSTHPTLGAMSGTMWEWYFRSSLDHWSAYLGLLFALNFPIASLFFRLLEAQPLFYHIAAKCMMGAFMLTIMSLWILGPLQLNELDYQDVNAYCGIIPVLSYVYFRNVTPWLRNHTLDLLHQIGKATLELYLLHHHIWLTSNSKSVLTLIPGWPLMNFLVVTILYVFMSHRLFHITRYLRSMILPDNRGACLRNLLGLFVTYGTFYILAALLHFVGMLNFLAVAFCSILFGWLLYQVIAARTRDFFVETTSCSAGKSNRCSPSRHLDISPLAGALVVIVIGFFWHHANETGAGPIQLLPAVCTHFVQRGKWISVDDCRNDMSLGASYRKRQIASFAICSNPLWGWDVSPSSELCRFSYRDAKNLQHSLQRRNITFVGDSILRHLYHASCRQLGDKTAGAYNTSMEKWSDFSRQYADNVQMEFRWAPYVSNLTNVLDRIELERSPDLVVVGGGAWDRLHTYNTIDEQTTLDHALALLLQELDRLKDFVPVVWVVPTTINSWALTSDEKKANIREDQMVEFRELYRQKGINDAVSFVLDGTLFTAGRVEESYDGVHYPLYVYDVGAQILANAMDWLLVDRKVKVSFMAKPVGNMGIPFLGLVMLVFILVGISSFDGFMGLSYMASFVLVKGAPYRLYDEAYSAYHLHNGILPGTNQSFDGVEMSFRQQIVHQHESDREDESEQLLNNALAA